METQIPIEEMLDLLEQTKKQLPALPFSWPLEKQFENGKFLQFKYWDTQCIWMGFQMGLRCAETIGKGEPRRQQQARQ